MNLFVKFGESVNILKSSEQCQQNENQRMPFKMADFLLGQKIDYINEPYESCKFHED